MTAKEALILSIYKYNWFVDHPEARVHPVYDRCSLCNQSEIGCNTCVMKDSWPTLSGTDFECDNADDDIWNIWACYHTAFPTKAITSYDRAFFALVLVEAFHDKLQSLYRRK